MILSSLTSFYSRNQQLPRYGMQWKPLSFIVVLSQEGEFIRLEDCREQDGKGKLFLLPKAVQRTSAPLPNLGWDNTSYAFQLSAEVIPWVQEKLSLLTDLSVQINAEGEPERLAQVGGKVVLLPAELLPGGRLLKDLPPELMPSFRLWKDDAMLTSSLPTTEEQESYSKTSAELTQEQELGLQRRKNKRNYLAFQQAVEEWHTTFSTHASVRALYLYYQQDWWHQLWCLKEDRLWIELVGHLPVNVSFRLEGHSLLIPQEMSSQQGPSLVEEEASSYGQCLVSGKLAPLVHTHTPIPIAGSQATARLVSFQRNVGYESYGWVKNENAPVSQQMEFAYTTALNFMLKKQSVHHFNLGNRTYVIWLQVNYDEEEAFLRDLQVVLSPYILSHSASKQPFPTIYDLLDRYEQWLCKISAWENAHQQKVEMVWLGMFPNAARLAVSLYKSVRVKDFLHHLMGYLRQIYWEETRATSKPYYALYSILQGLCMDNQLENLPPKWADLCVESWLEQRPFPWEMYRACVHQILRNCSFLYSQLSFVKYELMQSQGYSLLPYLDVKNTHPYYLLGRCMGYWEYLLKAKFPAFSFRYRYLPSVLRYPYATYKEMLHHYSSFTFHSFLENSELVQIQKELQRVLLPQRPNEIQQGLLIVGYAQQLQKFTTLLK